MRALRVRALSESLGLNRGDPQAELKLDQLRDLSGRPSEDSVLGECWRRSQTTSNFVDLLYPD